MRLGLGESLPGAQVQLPQADVEARLEAGQRGKGRGRVGGPAQIADEQGSGPGRGDQGRDGVGLGPAVVVERGVDLTLDPAVGVVTGPAVPQDDEPPSSAQGETSVRPAARSRSRSTNGMTGQSFQSRSRA